MNALIAISTVVGDDVARIALTGDVGLESIATISGTITSLLAVDGVRTIEIDLSRVPFIDSTGIGLLIGSRRLADQAGKNLRVLGTTGQVADVLEITGVAGYLCGATPERADAMTGSDDRMGW